MRSHGAADSDPAALLNPRQQGLKHRFGRRVGLVRHAALLNPRQQGLKHNRASECFKHQDAALLNPRQQGLKRIKASKDGDKVAMPHYSIQDNKD